MRHPHLTPGDPLRLLGAEVAATAAGKTGETLHGRTMDLSRMPVRETVRGRWEVARGSVQKHSIRAVRVRSTWTRCKPWTR
jgi:hypothetical protein